MLRGQQPVAWQLFSPRNGQFDPTGMPVWILAIGTVLLFLLALRLFSRQFEGE
jgi:hypothetical protein